MNFNATPVENALNMPPQQNDPALMSQIMREAHLDHQRPHVQPMYQPSYQPMPPVSFESKAKESDSFVPQIDINALVEKMKEPLAVAALFFILSTNTVQDILKQQLPSIFQNEDAMKQLLVKAAIAGIGFLVIKHLLKIE